MRLLLLGLLTFANSTLAFPTGDVPLTPANGGRTVKASALKPGDIIVSTTPQVQSVGIRWATGADVSHSIVMIDNGHVIEAIGEGVVLHPVDKAISDASLAVVFRHPRMTSALSEDLKDFLLLQLGKKYNFWGLVKHPRFQILPDLCNAAPAALRPQCKAWKGKVRLTPSGKDEFFCSELIFHGYRNIGLPLSAANPAGSEPAQVPVMSIIEELQYVGHLKTP